MSTQKKFASICGALLLAGQACAAHAGGPVSLTSSGCEEQELSVQYPAEAFRKMLPPGFKLHTLDPAGLIAMIDIGIDRCASIDGGEGSMDYTAFVEVDPPAEYMQSDVVGYGLMLEIRSTRQQTVDAFNAWGFGKQAALGQIDFGMALDLQGRKIGSTKVKSTGSTLIATTVMTEHATPYPAGGTRGFAQDAEGNLHIVDARWTDQMFVYGAGTLMQVGSGPLPLKLPAQALPVLGGYATGYSLTLHWIQ